MADITTRDPAEDLDDALEALVRLLAAVNVATLEDPSKHRVANTVGGPALVARQVLMRHGRLDALNRAVQDQYGSTDEVHR